MSSNQSFIIDATENIKVAYDSYLNELNTLSSLRHGMLHLYKYVRECEKIGDQATKDSCLSIMCGSFSFLNPENIMTLRCFYHWFANTLYNYVRLCGLIICLEQKLIVEDDLTNNMKKVSKEVTNYLSNKLDQDFQDVIKWRHKVSGHFAKTMPNSSDNIATLESSVMYNLCYCRDNKVNTEGRILTEAMNLTLGDGVNDYQSELPTWSLTDIFEKFVARFWADLTFKQGI